VQRDISDIIAANQKKTSTVAAEKQQLDKLSEIQHQVQRENIEKLIVGYASPPFFPSLYLLLPSPPFFSPPHLLPLLSFPSSSSHLLLLLFLFLLE